MKPLRAVYNGSKRIKGFIVAFTSDDETRVIFVQEDGRIIIDDTYMFRVLHPGMVDVKYRKGKDENRKDKPAE